VCGINSIFAYNSGSVAEEKELLASREAMVARGPDGSGAWISPDGDIGFASRRLSIIDLTDAGAQLMATEDGSLRLVFNDEITTTAPCAPTCRQEGIAFDPPPIPRCCSISTESAGRTWCTIFEECTTLHSGMTDASREAVRNGALGILVDPSDQEDIKAGVLETLNRLKGVVPEGLDYFSYGSFERRLHRIVESIIASEEAVRREHGGRA
jgi:hypothetical protein